MQPSFVFSLSPMGIRLIPLNHPAIVILFVLDGEGEPIDMDYELAANLLFGREKYLN
jgi:hypothetical protein